MKGKKSQREKKGKQATSCVSQFSQVKHLLDNPTVHIEDQWVENNISKFQLNPTVDEVAMVVFPKGVCLAPGQSLASAWPAPEVPEHAEHSIKRVFLSFSGRHFTHS